MPPGVPPPDPEPPPSSPPMMSPMPPAPERGLASRPALLLREQAEHDRRQDRQQLAEVDARRLRLGRQLLRDGLLLIPEDVAEDLLAVRGVDAVDIHRAVADGAGVLADRLQDRLRAFRSLRIALQPGEDGRAALLDRLPRDARVDPELAPRSGPPAAISGCRRFPP